MPMESMFREARWRLWLVVLVPLAAGALAFGMAFDDPPQHRATATLLAPRPVGSSAIPQVTAQAVANLQGILDSAGLLRQVAEETGATESTIRAGLSDQRLELSNVVELSFTHTDPELVATVTTAAATQAMILLTQGDVQRASFEEQLAEAEYNDAANALQELLRSTGSVDPEAELSELIRRLAVAETPEAPSDEPSGPASPSLSVEQLRERIAELQVAVPEYRRAREERDAALEDFLEARERLFSVMALSDTAPEAFVIAPTGTVEISRRLPLVRTVATVSGIAFALAVGLVMLLQVVTTNVKNQRSHDESSRSRSAA